MPNRTAVITVQYTDEQLPRASDLSLDRRMALTRMANHLHGLASGTRQGTVDYQVDGGTAVAASGTVTFASASGTTVTINGVGISQGSGTDAELAAAAAAAIIAHANPLVQLVTAYAQGPVLYVVAKEKGPIGNAITLAAIGTGVTVSGPRLTGGTSAAANAVTI